MSLGQRQAAGRARGRRVGRADPVGGGSGLTLPYDHSATFDLTGDPGRVHEAVISTDVDGAFVAEAIGYGLEQERSRPLEVRPAGGERRSNNFSPQLVNLTQLPFTALVRGFRLAADAREDALTQVGPGGGTRLRWKGVRLPPRYRETLLESLEPARSSDFLFSMVDTATGRELQDEPTHSVAALGTGTGRRPFRRLAQPMSFQARSTLRLQVVELSPDVRGTLFVVLYGYKVLRLAGCPEPVAASVRLLQSLRRGALPDARIVPFDHVVAVELLGRPHQRARVEVPVNVEGAFVATSIGYGLQVPERDVAVQPDPARPREGLSPTPGADWDLTALELGDLPPDALLDGIRIRPDLVRLALRDNGQLSRSVPSALVAGGGLFERLNRPEDVSFRYLIEDAGTGRDLQDAPIHNLAGLGAADGQRPFRRLMRPLALLPRSTLRVTIEERYGRGRLFLVFQGFKVLGANLAAAPAARRMPARGR